MGLSGEKSGVLMLKPRIRFGHEMMGTSLRPSNCFSHLSRMSSLAAHRNWTSYGVSESMFCSRHQSNLLGTTVHIEKSRAATRGRFHEAPTERFFAEPRQEAAS